MIQRATGNLGPFYQFFETYGSERLNGLNESHFAGLTPAEKEEAWNYLKDRFESSDERISGMYKLDPSSATVLFKEALKQPIEPSPYAASRESQELCRLLLLNFVNSIEPNSKYVDAMIAFAGSEFKDVRAKFAMSVPIYHPTRQAVDALTGMILNETEQIPLTSAITKYMVIHGMDFEIDDPLYRSTYIALYSDDPKGKMAVMRRLEDNHLSDYT